MVRATGIVIDSSTLDESSGLRLVYQCCLRIFMNRPLRTRMMGGVGAGGENPLATRLDRAATTGLTLCDRPLDRFHVRTSNSFSLSFKSDDTVSGL
jgi:hypothetical protein